jgi:hypothetical protein
VLAGVIDRQPLGERKLGGDDEVDAPGRLEAVLHGGQQGVPIRRDVDAGALFSTVEHRVDEARHLVGVAVVVLAPALGGQQVVQ